MQLTTGVVLAAMLLGAPLAHAAEEPHISNNGFSFTFPAHWWAKLHSEGFVMAHTLAKSKVKATLSLYFILIPPHATQEQIILQRSRQGWHNVMDLVDKDELKKSRWNAPFKRTVIGKDLTREDVAMEETLPTEDSTAPEKIVCKYIREYKAPFAVVQVIYTQSGSCAGSAKDFEALNQKFTWKR